MSRPEPARPAPRRPRTWLRLAAGLTLTVAAVALAASTGCMERLFYYPSRGETRPPEELADVETVWFESSDGTRLHGWLVPAVGVPRGEAPTILHVHGNAGNLESHIGFTDYLPAAGFNLFVFDYRGYGRSAGRARRRGPLIADTDAALDALLARDDLDDDRIGMYAQSLGGGIGLNVMAGRPEIRAAVIESAFTGWREIAAAAFGGDPPGPIARSLARLLIRGGRRPVDAIARIERPILILHGTSDSVIPVSHGRRLAEAGPTAKLVELPGGEHNSLRWTHPEVERTVVDFFRENLEAGDGATK